PTSPGTSPPAETQILKGRSMHRRHWLRFALAFSVVLTLVSASQTAAAKGKKPQQPARGASTTTPVPRGGGWMVRHKQINARVKQGNVDLIFIGDSITQGWEGSGKKVWDEFYGK